MKFDFSEIDAFFEDLGTAYVGPLAADDVILKSFGGRGWRVKTLGVVLIIHVDGNFPFSRPTAYLENFDQRLPKPHVEPQTLTSPHGRLCLKNGAMPTAPLLSIRSTLFEARNLLKTHEDGTEGDDFAEDFLGYWNNYPTAKDLTARTLHIPKENAAGSYVLLNGSYLAFRDRGELDAWWKNRFGERARRVRQSVTLVLDTIPRPDRFPGDIDEFLRLVGHPDEDKLSALRVALSHTPKDLLVLLAAETPSGRNLVASVELRRKRASTRADVRRDSGRRKLAHKMALAELLSDYDLKRLRTARLDSAMSRLDPKTDHILSTKSVIIVGCGALGSGVATMLAKAGVRNITLIDPETLSWENIRRHELGAPYVGQPKALALMVATSSALPEMKRAKAINSTIQQAITENTALFHTCDLVIAATGDWAADSFIATEAAKVDKPIAVIYGWMEAFGLATHAVAFVGTPNLFLDGFDEVGSFKLPASAAKKPIPLECGNSTSPFGAIELAQGQAVVARLALECLRGKIGKPTWRTWTADASTLDDAQGEWTEGWITTRGQPSPYGGVSEATWSFASP